MAAIETVMSQHQYRSTTTTPNDPTISRLQPLRRAVYIKVADLALTYSIDPAVLNDELARVNAERESLLSEDKSKRLFGGVPTEFDTSLKKRLQPPRGGNNMVL
jgi:hypothetical protein